MNLASPATALSPAVKRLICCVGCQVEEQDGDTVTVELMPVMVEKESETGGHTNNPPGDGDGGGRPFVSSHGALDLDRIASLFPASDDSAGYFQAAVRVLAPVFAQCQGVLSALSSEQLESVLMPRLQWTQSQKIFHDCLMLLGEQQEDSAGNILVLLLLSAVLERALGNVYLLKGGQCPSMLKDLLVTEELTSTVGLCAVQILRAVIGPPTSLNLRNVAWHGFLGDGELPRRYCCFLVVLAASVGDVLTGRALHSIPQRPFFLWTPAVRTRLSAALQVSESSEATLPDVQAMKTVLRDSGVSQPQTEEQWELVLRLYTRGSYGYCLALLLPLLEHVLRRVFATVNGCPQRVLTAESSTLYTTLNEILDQTLPDGSPNLLPEFLTTPCMDLLHDLLMYPEGPRVRDHLSHGEVECGSVDQTLVWPFLHVAVFTALRLCPQAESACHSHCRAMERRVQSYRSVFHPVAILQHKFADLLDLLENTESLELDSIHRTLLGEGGEGGQLWADNPLLTKTEDTVRSIQHWHPFCAASHTNGHGLELEALKKIAHQHIPTLFRWQAEGQPDAGPGVMKERECVGVLLRIAEECSTAVQHVQHTLQQRQQQLSAKQLRSRHRDNLRKLLLCVPCLQILMSVVCAAVGWTMQRLPDYASLTAPQSRMLHKFLKGSLQQCENLRTLTSPDKNKWTESVELLTHWVSTCHRFLHNWHQHQHCT